MGGWTDDQTNERIYGWMHVLVRVRGRESEKGDGEKEVSRKFYQMDGWMDGWMNGDMNKESYKETEKQKDQRLKSMGRIKGREYK